MSARLDDFAFASALDHARPSLFASRSPRAARVVARILGVGLALLVLALVFAPWQQSVPGKGRVIAYAPLERQQVVEAPIAGRVRSWHVQEGDRVRAGEIIAELSDNDPEILARIERERNAALARASAAAGAVEVAKARIAALELAREAKGMSADLRVDMSRNRCEGAERAVDAAVAAKRTAKLNLERQRALFDEGLTSKRQLELAEMEFETKEAELDRARATLTAARREVGALDADRDHVGADASASIEGARESLRKAESELAKVEAEVQKVDSRLARQRRMSVEAPRDGTILSIIAKQDAQMLGPGDPLALFVPDLTASAVELWVDGKDGPLVTPGREVRLQFEGWPAVQFVGWPSAAVGTFPGVVEFVDATADAYGRFRVVVSPAGGDEPWPDSRWLRQGVRANGWILLERVSLGFEMWRQFNGFPPVVSPEPGGGEGGA
ncbi:putative efflux pump membrane fusion protein [Enhygromyxa salina]|uniref:Putative efflux pump membrane fusion protein n=1 Tax=Enhygromyxa salina TaxID=215803 RepID=A0A2S9XJN6_9BACT|nr:HlyD family efflux transporter periplasmic adaptor subunit [Enhygromyxa salina]PRP92950.1 putative efflux pump membrane fusion protein [Enhygromyxa salina]